MKHTNLISKWLLGSVAVLAGTLVLAGCHGRHPDDKMAVYAALSQHNLNSIEVFQDRESGMLTLRGIVGSPDQKSNAENVARQAAPGYSIKNQVQVDSAGLEGLENKASQTAQLDSSIEDHFKASIQTNKRLEKRGIQYSASNGTLYLKGAVKTKKEKREAEELARKVPQVQHVVNDLAVKPS